MSTQTKTSWLVDASHSEVLFKVKHLVISTVTGSFKDYSATMESNDLELEGAKIQFSANINSIDTNNAQRDEHLKSADFFAADEFPQLTFESTSFTKKAENLYDLSGNLSIRGTTLPITLSVEHGGTVTDPYGQVKAGFELSGSISRKAFGLNWNAVTEAGGVVVSDEVKLILNIQMVKQ